MEQNNQSGAPEQQNSQSGQHPEVEQKQANAGMAALCYLGLLLIIPLLAAKDDPFVKFHLKQGIALLVFWLVGTFLGFIPILGWLVAAATTIIGIILIIQGVSNALGGREKDLPIVGQYAEKFNF